MDRVQTRTGDNDRGPGVRVPWEGGVTSPVGDVWVAEIKGKRLGCEWVRNDGGVVCGDGWMEEGVDVWE